MSDTRQSAILRLCFILIAYLVGNFLVAGWRQQASVELAIAKGQQLYVSPAQLPAALQSDKISRLERRIGSSQILVNTLLLNSAESRPWAEAGCEPTNCLHVTLYDQASGVLINQIVSADSLEVLAEWYDPLARPQGSALVAPEALAIAASDPAVTAVLGEIGAGDPAMIPMSAWLNDGACKQDWCVDLTFHNPAGDGRIFHVFVNMRQQSIARTFFTRARPELDVAAPVAQRDAFTNGCHEKDGWTVCWEMTAHDGLLFQGATYNGTPIFDSIKITQIEAWYPSWPGGYRDEIGFSATVPPFGGTLVNEFEDGFEVRQLFTEFTRWPNCICCYRYEQIIRFFADGSFEPRFISYGPGCDDPSIYRPFWRIDLELAEVSSSRVWLWHENDWTEQQTEIELYPFMDELGPDGYKLVTASGDILYRWAMLATDPLGLDEARFFVLKESEMEGQGPVSPGPGDTFQPPRQWLDEESIAGEDVVIWFVPLLKTKQTEPLWCLPDPEPGVNQCEAILRVEKIDALPQPSPDQSVPTATTAAAIPRATAVTPGPTATPRPVQGDSVEEIILNAGCGSCHRIGSLGEAHKVGPDLSSIGYQATGRIPGMSAADYLRQSIVDPNAALAPLCPNGDCLPNIMPKDYDQRLTAAQVELIVDYLLDLDSSAPVNDVTVIGSGGAAFPKSEPLNKASGNIVSGVDASTASVQLLMVGLVFLLTLFLLWKRPYEE